MPAKAVGVYPGLAAASVVAATLATRAHSGLANVIAALASSASAAISTPSRQSNRLWYDRLL
jgi:hypothetical protein